MRILVSVILAFVSAVSFAQYYGPIGCEGYSAVDLKYRRVVYDDDPFVFEVFFDCSSDIMKFTSGYWAIPVRGKELVPVYAVFLNDNASMYDAAELSYNWFRRHPDCVVYSHEDFYVVAERRFLKRSSKKK